ncbi:MAG: hypothetical protein AAF628_27865 [Planctomycetota bacterium]
MQRDHGFALRAALGVAFAPLLVGPLLTAQTPEATLVVTDLLAPDLDPSDRGDAAGRLYRLLTPRGREFHASGTPITDLRTVRPPDGSAQIYLWDERTPDGARTHHFAISRDGLDLAGRARATDYQVRLADGTFDPLDGVPLVDPVLQAAPDNSLFLVQFQSTPLPEFRLALESHGVRVHRFLTDHAFLVQASAPLARWLRSLDIVRWVGPYHPAYRLAPALRDLVTDSVGPGAEVPARTSIMTLVRGRDAQTKLADLITAIGGTVHLATPEGFRLEATLTPQQLLIIAHRDEVQYIDPWGGPGETDMDIVRTVGGANFIQSTLGFTGQGMRGEIFDTELLTSHQEWGPAPILHSSGTTGGLHGTSCYSINFATGVDAASRGMCPDGIGMFFRYNESTQFGGAVSRYTINQQLLDPAGPYRAVFQTSSVGSARTTAYTTISAETDDYLFLHQVLSTQSQSNAGNQNSRPQAWAKNIVSCGGVYHFGTATLSDDRWNFGASIGPAADGRIKPDLAYFYDGIRAASGSGTANYTGFGGTSAATPETAGHFGIFYQMWHNQVWSGFGGGTSVFASRPEMATAKAMMINHATRYNWTAGGANADIDRFKQGWGLANLQQLYNDRDDTIIIDETDVLAPLTTNTYDITVAAGTPELRVTLAYTDPMGTVGAAQARVNDLSLRVTSPSGTVYWGNNGLTAGNVSTAGGTANDLDNVENVLLTSPAAGDWTVDVIGDEIVQDAHLETAALDADYGLVIAGAELGSGGPGEPCTEAPIPSYVRTYSNGTRTRGMWFTAPIDFEICGLQVPDEQGHGLQNVEVVRFNGGATPPTWSSTTSNVTSLFRSVGASAANRIDTAIKVSAGDVIGILGAAGDASIMHNSYGASSFTSNIDGTPMGLFRLGMQSNLVTTPATGLFTSGGSISRVRMWYRVGGAAETFELDIAPYARTYSNGTRTRGYWFTCPADVKITSLRVPDEQGHGLQNVEIVRFNGGVTPPVYSATTNAFTSLFRSIGAPSSQRLTTNIDVNAGDVIGILGAAGDTSIMHNSYGNGPHSTTILGEPVTLSRMGMQFNLAGNAARDIWSQTSGSIARVEVEYQAR